MTLIINWKGNQIMPQHTNGMANITVDTRYLAINGHPLTQAAVEQLERAWTGREFKDVVWVAKVVIAHGVGDQRFAHDVAIGQMPMSWPDNGRAVLVALRISEVTDDALKKELRNKPLGLLMF